jgi:hypothetical protein
MHIDHSSTSLDIHKKLSSAGHVMIDCFSNRVVYASPSSAFVLAILFKCCIFTNQELSYLLDRNNLQQVGSGEIDWIEMHNNDSKAMVQDGVIIVVIRREGQSRD